MPEDFTEDIRSLLQINTENTKSQAVQLKIIQAHFGGSLKISDLYCGSIQRTPRAKQCSSRSYRHTLVEVGSINMEPFTEMDLNFTLLDKHRTRFQFGGTPGVGCRDGLFTLKALLNARHNHDLALYVGFVNLLKAYDTANHKLLIHVLRQCAPTLNLQLPSRRSTTTTLVC